MFGNDADIQEEAVEVSAPLSMVQFSSEGHAINLGKATLEQAGFKENSILQVTRNVTTQTQEFGVQQWELNKINTDGPAVLRKIAKDGSFATGDLTTAPLDVMLRDYKEVAHQIELDVRGPFLPLP